jgi:hypothetical protein
MIQHPINKTYRKKNNENGGDEIIEELMDSQ